jgi:2-dehydropantoate 2-reductase
MAKVAVVGVGAIGGVIAGLLAAAERHQIVLCTRRPMTALRVDTPDGPVTVQADNLTDPTQASVVDWVLIATKTYDADGAALWLRGLCGPQTRVAVVQNGVEHRENFAPDFAVLPVIIDVPAERRPDGSVLQRAAATLNVELSAEGHEFANLFAGTQAQVQVTPDFLSAAWNKLCLNSAGVVSALTLRSAGVLRDEALGQVALGLIAECVAVGRAVGATLDDHTGERILAAYRAGSPDSINSLLADRMAGRKTEIDARNGVIVRRGAKHGIPTPLNSMALALFKGMQPIAN